MVMPSASARYGEHCLCYDCADPALFPDGPVAGPIGAGPALAVAVCVRHAHGAAILRLEGVWGPGEKSEGERGESFSPEASHSHVHPTDVRATDRLGVPNPAHPRPIGVPASRSPLGVTSRVRPALCQLFAVIYLHGTTIHSPSPYPTPGLPPMQRAKVAKYKYTKIDSFRDGRPAVASSLSCARSSVRASNRCTASHALLPSPSPSCLRLWPPTNNVSQCPRRVSHEGRNRPVRLCPKAGAGARTAEGVSSPPLCFFSLPARPSPRPPPPPPRSHNPPHHYCPGPSWYVPLLH